MVEQESVFDIVIVGGGLIGIPMAVACATAGMRVAIIDHAKPHSCSDTVFDGRVSAINRSSYLMLDTIGVWQHIEPKAQPINDIRVVDSDAPLFLHFDHKEGVPSDQKPSPYGFMVENRVLLKALDLRVREFVETITRFAPDEAVSIDRAPNQVTITLKSDHTIHAPLLVAADGRKSGVRELANIPSHGWTYAQTGIVLAMYHDKPHHGLALERFRAGGPFAVLPMVDDETGRHQSGIVWCENPKVAKNMLVLDDRAFLEELTRRVGSYLGNLSLKGPRWSFPLALNHARRYFDHRMALVGDAAHAMHPVAGQGLNLGLRDVASLAQAVIDQRRLGLDIGAELILKRYDHSRKLDAMALMGMTDMLTRLFSNNKAPIDISRKIGLATVQRLTPLKVFFTRHATKGSGNASKSRLLVGESL